MNMPSKRLQVCIDAAAEIFVKSARNGSRSKYSCERDLGYQFVIAIGPSILSEQRLGNICYLARRIDRIGATLS